ncbi:Nibrin [Bienertia sinuspersici]
MGTLAFFFPRRVYLPNIFIIILSLTTSFFTQTSSRIINPSLHISSSSYSQHCSQIVSESTPTDSYFNSQTPTFYSAFVVNGDQLLEPNYQITANLIPRNIDATLVIRIIWSRFRNPRFLLSVHGGPRVRTIPRRVRFHLSGFWDSSSGQLCMVGSGTKRKISGNNLNLDVVFKSNYPNSTVIDSSLITGTLESLNSGITSF